MTIASTEACDEEVGFHYDIEQGDLVSLVVFCDWLMDREDARAKGYIVMRDAGVIPYLPTELRTPWKYGFAYKRHATASCLSKAKRLWFKLACVTQREHTLTTHSNVARNYTRIHHSVRR